MLFKVQGFDIKIVVEAVQAEFDAWLYLSKKNKVISHSLAVTCVKPAKRSLDMDCIAVISVVYSEDDATA